VTDTGTSPSPAPSSGSSSNGNLASSPEIDLGNGPSSSPAAVAAGPVAVVVLGRPGVEREAVEILLRTAGLDVIDLVRMESPNGTGRSMVVAVLVEPDAGAWRVADGLGARVVVVLDAPPSDERTIQLLVAGADAVLHAGVEVERLLAAVRVVGIGQAFLATGQARTVVDRLRAGKIATELAPALTGREVDILLSIERGESVRETADGLGISMKTVQNLQSRLFRKLDARNRPQAIARAYELGLVEGSVR
jgi:DNA-binding NarL/FixJ family response regulator